MKKLLLFITASLVVFTLSAEPSQKSSSEINNPATNAYGTSMPKQSFTISNTDIQKIKETKIASFKTLFKQTEAVKDVENELTLDSVITERIDSGGILQLVMKTTPYYDRNGYDSLRFIYGRDLTESKWVIDQREEFAYDKNGNKLKEIHYHINASTGEWYGVDKYEDSYDTAGNKTGSSSYRWDSIRKDWTGDSKYTAEFNSNKDQTMKCDFEWDTTANNWIGKSKVETSYFASQKELSRIVYKWNKTNSEWSIRSKTDFSYNEDSLQTVALSSEFDDSAQQMVNARKEVMAYDSAGNISSFMGYAWEEEWRIQQSTEYVYDSNGNEILYTNSRWNNATQQMVYSTKEVAEFDENNERTLAVNFYWDSDSSEWICSYKSETSRNKDTGITTIVNYEQNEIDSLVATGKYEIKADSLNRMTMVAMYTVDSTGVFYPMLKEEVNYDEFGNASLTTLYVIDETTGEFVLLYKVNSVFSGYEEELSTIAYLRDEITGELYLEMKRETIWQKPLEKIIVDYRRNAETNELELNLRNTYYYSNGSLPDAAANFEETKITTYPNPASTIVNFRLNDNSPTQIELFNLQGTKVISRKLSVEKQLSVSHLNKGVYIYNIIQNNKNYKGKMIVK